MSLGARVFILYRFTSDCLLTGPNLFFTVSCQNILQADSFCIVWDAGMILKKIPASFVEFRRRKAEFSPSVPIPQAHLWFFLSSSPKLIILYSFQYPLMKWAQNKKPNDSSRPRFHFIPFLFWLPSHRPKSFLHGFLLEYPTGGLVLCRLGSWNDFKRDFGAFCWVPIKKSWVNDSNTCRLIKIYHFGAGVFYIIVK